MDSQCNAELSFLSCQPKFRWCFDKSVICAYVFDVQLNYCIILCRLAFLLLSFCYVPIALAKWNPNKWNNKYINKCKKGYRHECTGTLNKRLYVQSKPFCFFLLSRPEIPCWRLKQQLFKQFTPNKLQVIFIKWKRKKNWNRLSEIHNF